MCAEAILWQISAAPHRSTCPARKGGRAEDWGSKHDTKVPRDPLRATWPMVLDAGRTCTHNSGQDPRRRSRAAPGPHRLQRSHARATFFRKFCGNRRAGGGTARNTHTRDGAGGTSRAEGCASRHEGGGGRQRRGEGHEEGRAHRDSLNMERCDQSSESSGRGRRSRHEPGPSFI